MRPSVLLGLLAFVVLVGLVETAHGCGGGLLDVTGSGGATGVSDAGVDG